MYKVTQTDLNHAGRVSVYADSFIVTADGNVVCMSAFGTTSSMKSITAQIIANRGGILIRGEDGFVTGEHGQPVNLKRGSDRLKTMTKNIRPGIVHRIFYSENLFRPWKFFAQGERVFLTFGETEEEARARMFSIVDKISEIPLKETWRDWLWEILTADWQWPETDLIAGGVENTPRFTVLRVFAIPDDEWLLTHIREELEYLRAA